MVEISLSGSGEGPGWATSRPTLQRHFCPMSVGAHPRNPTAWTPQRLWVPLPAPAGRRAGEVRGKSSGCSGGERLETARRWEGRMAHGRAHAHRYTRDLRGAHVADRTTLARAESHTQSSWRQRAGAMGGGTDASWRGRRMRVITASWVMTAMIRSVPRRQNGHVALSRPQTRPSSLAHGQ